MARKKVVLLEELSNDELITKINALEQEVTDQKELVKKLKKEGTKVAEPVGKKIPSYHF